MYSRTVAFLVGMILVLSGCAVSPEIDHLLKKGNTAYEEGRLGEAEQYLNRAVEKDQTIKGAWFLLGNIHYRHGRYPAAVTAYEKTLQYDSDHADAWHNLALTRMRQAGDIAESGIKALPAEKNGVKKLLKLRRELMLNDVRE